jgi:hypothetical protein
MLVTAPGKRIRLLGVAYGTDDEMTGGRYAGELFAR